METLNYQSIPPWHSPRSRPGSLLLAILIHSFFYFGIIISSKIDFFSQTETPISSAEITYELLSEPPPPPAVVQPLKRAPEVRKEDDVKTKPDHRPKRVQDEKGPVAGTQKEVKVERTIASNTDGNAISVPYYRIKPKYPRAALLSSMEGWVLFKIDINAEGLVEHIRGIDGVNRNMFQEEARRALARWKYKPKLDKDGKPVPRIDHEVRVDFKLNDI